MNAIKKRGSVFDRVFPIGMAGSGQESVGNRSVFAWVFLPSYKNGDRKPSAVSSQEERAMNRTTTNPS